MISWTLSQHYANGVSELTKFSASPERAPLIVDVIVNPHAGSSSARPPCRSCILELEQKLERPARSAFPSARWRSTRCTSPSTPGTRASSRRTSWTRRRRPASGIEHLLIGCGGDGTSNEICTALVHADGCRPGPAEAPASAPGHGQRRGGCAHVRGGLRPDPRAAAHGEDGRAPGDAARAPRTVLLQHRKHRAGRVHRRAHQQVQARHPRGSLQVHGGRRLAVLRAARAAAAHGHSAPRTMAG